MFRRAERGTCRYLDPDNVYNDLCERDPDEYDQGGTKSDGTYEILTS